MTEAGHRTLRRGFSLLFSKFLSAIALRASRLPGRVATTQQPPKL
jgi:hypothetical protein